MCEEQCDSYHFLDTLYLFSAPSAGLKSVKTLATTLAWNPSSDNSRSLLCH